MRWIEKFQLFLFDFDGLLVNTEHLHYQAYVNVFTKRGLQLPLSFHEFVSLAHLNSKAWKEAIYTALPEVESIWPQIYQEKCESFKELVLSGKIELMEGVEPLLKELEAKNIRRCVVTNSFLDQIELIRAQLPILRTIPHYLTREDYEKPKPSPDGYLKAILMYGQKGDRIVGFEDSVRGFKALCQTPATAVLICPEHYPLLDIALDQGGLHFPSFLSIRVDHID